ncbi:hypothetical protein psyc5s11_43680 [Clostridium gelidum]|uniref:Uncharacterized protein n=1 Tax=Clostridium gelidum TaxID=704125 RepID=A0ABM7TAC8_9CLOT|nr:hypothetical protein [Clostridium gelidum]BCZ48301.1 hypothetical protein psyc5s11_43680 [Clostridium gelidum]
MYDNRIISDSHYVVASINGSTVDNRISKRPYTKPTVPPRKKEKPSDSFDDTLHSTISHNSSNDDSAPFSNELENMLRLKSEENARLVQSKFNHNTLSDSSSKNNTNTLVETELHNKLSQAMEVKVDTSTIYKKVELLNALRNESNN